MLFSSSHTPPRPKLEFEAIPFLFSKHTNFTLPHYLEQKFKNIKVVAFCLHFPLLWFAFVSLFFTPCLHKLIQGSWTLHFMRILPFTLMIRRFLGPKLIFVFYCIVFCHISPARPVAPLIPGDQAPKNVDHASRWLLTVIFSSSFCILVYWLVSKDIILRYSLYVVIFKSLYLTISHC